MSTCSQTSHNKTDPFKKFHQNIARSSAMKCPSLFLNFFNAWNCYSLTEVEAPSIHSTMWNTTIGWFGWNSLTREDGLKLTIIHHLQWNELNNYYPTENEHKFKIQKDLILSVNIGYLIVSQEIFLFEVKSLVHLNLSLDYCQGNRQKLEWLNYTGYATHGLGRWQSTSRAIIKTEHGNCIWKPLTIYVLS